MVHFARGKGGRVRVEGLKNCVGINPTASAWPFARGDRLAFKGGVKTLIGS